MKIKSGFMLRNIADQWIVVPLGERVVDFNGLITLNETGAFLWQRLEEGADKQQLIEALTEEFEVDEDTAMADIGEFIDCLLTGKILGQ